MLNPIVVSLFKNYLVSLTVTVTVITTTYNTHTTTITTTTTATTTTTTTTGSNGQKLVYQSAALAIIHDIGSNTQTFFDLHKDDVSCVALSRCGGLAATGAVGRAPSILIWKTDLDGSNGTNGMGGTGGSSYTSSVGGKATIDFQRDSSWPEELMMTCGKG